MKALGIKQFHQKTFKLLDLEGSPFQHILGNIPKFFTCVIGGFSGNGKTEFCIQLAKEFCERFRVKASWWSYEQRHGFDLQTATIRNKMEEVSGLFIPIDPIANLPQGKTLLEDLDEYLSKRNSSEYVFIDSIDYTNWKKDDYLYLKEKYEGKKTFIFICHTDKSGNPRKAIASDIIFDGGMFIHVSKYIATPQKNRFGGFESYVVWEKRARELNPLFFDPKTRVKEKSTPKQGEIFAKKSDEDEGVDMEIPAESMGVDAKIKLKVLG